MKTLLRPSPAALATAEALARTLRAELLLPSFETTLLRLLEPDPARLAAARKAEAPLIERMPTGPRHA